MEKYLSSIEIQVDVSKRPKPKLAIFLGKYNMKVSYDHKVSLCFYIEKWVHAITTSTHSFLLHLKEFQFEYQLHT